jgi:hypothetical protein
MKLKKIIMLKIKEKLKNTINNKNNRINSYLSKKDKLSLSWLSLYTITIILILFQTVGLHNQMYKEADNIKQNLNNTCILIESLSSELSNIPENINKMTINNINFILFEIKSGLISSVDIIENVTLWFINNYKNTLKCLLLLAINGGIDLVENASHIFENNANEALSSFNIQINNINSDLSNIQSKINNIPFANIQLPSIPEISVNNITIPSDFYSSLENINNSFPEILLSVDNYLMKPFDILKSKINSTSFNFENNITSSSNSADFCQEKILEIDEEIINWINKIYTYSIIILIIFIICITIINFLYINYKEKIYITNINKIIEKNNVITSKENVFYILDYINFPITDKIITHLNPIIPKNNQKIILKWFLNYIFYQPSAICFIMAISGIFFTYIQIGLIRSLKYNIINNLTISIDNLIKNINNNNYDNYIETINNNINITETNINNDLFGWVNVGTIKITHKSSIFRYFFDFYIIGNQNISSNTIQIDDGLLINIFNNYELYLFKSLNLYWILFIIWCIVLFMGTIKIIYKIKIKK